MTGEIFVVVQSALGRVSTTTDGQKLSRVFRVFHWVCRAARLEKASKEFNGLAQRSEQQATAFEHKVLSKLAWLFLRNKTADSQIGVMLCHTSQQVVSFNGWLTPHRMAYQSQPVILMHVRGCGAD